MKYVMLIAEDPSLYAELGGETRRGYYDAIVAHIEKWEGQGRYVPGGTELQSADSGQTIRRNGSGGVAITDGPYAELKEVIGGFMMIEADSLEDAVETASQWPGIQYGACVEVRPAVINN